MATCTAQPTTLRQDIERTGFTVLPDVFDDAALACMRRILDAEHAGSGAPALTGWGYAIHPLLQRAPAMAPFYQHPRLVAAFEAILGGPVRLAHSGARLASEASQPAIGWHGHYAWPAADLATRTGPQRLLMNVYVDGSQAGAGALVVLPRALRDPLDAPHADPLADWQGQQLVQVSPGSAVLFDTALWHTAKRGTAPGRRRLWGGHIMPLTELRPHREDNDTTTAQVRRLEPVPAMPV